MTSTSTWRHGRCSTTTLRAAPGSCLERLCSARSIRRSWAAPETGMSLRSHAVEITDHFGHWHHVAQVNVDVEQVGLVEQLATLGDRLARHDDAEAVRCVSAGGIDAVARAHAGHDQRVDAKGRQHLVEVGPLECGGVALADEWFVGPAFQARVELEEAAGVG